MGRATTEQTIPTPGCVAMTTQVAISEAAQNAWEATFLSIIPPPAGANLLEQATEREGAREYPLDCVGVVGGQAGSRSPS